MQECNKPNYFIFFISYIISFLIGKPLVILCVGLYNICVNFNKYKLLLLSYILGWLLFGFYVFVYIIFVSCLTLTVFYFSKISEYYNNAKQLMSLVLNINSLIPINNIDKDINDVKYVYNKLIYMETFINNIQKYIYNLFNNTYNNIHVNPYITNIFNICTIYFNHIIMSLYANIVFLWSEFKKYNSITTLSNKITNYSELYKMVNDKQQNELVPMDIQNISNVENFDMSVMMNELTSLMSDITKNPGVPNTVSNNKKKKKKKNKKKLINSK